MRNGQLLGKGEHHQLLKLTQGTAHYLHQGLSVHVVAAPCYLNLVEAAMAAPLLKTLKVYGKCQKVKVGEPHRALLRQLKELGLHKTRFPLFNEVASPLFQELALLGKVRELRKQESFRSKEDHLYLIVTGSLTISGTAPA
jgi:hypothetical protein